MRKFTLAAGLALLLAAPASAASIDVSHTIRASGSVLSDKTTGTLGIFRVNFHAGPTQKVRYVNTSNGVVFHSTRITFIDYTNQSQAVGSGWSVKIRGLGVINGKTVPFTAIAVDHPAPLGTDIFRISWGHGASLGGKLQSGGVKIRQL